MSYDRNKVIAIAEAEVGYLEKKSNSNLDDKTANAGSKNYTKYARDLDAISGFYNGKKNGYAWCDVFVDWCFVTTYGVEAALKLLCQPKKSAGAGCRYSRNYYKQKGRLFDSPEPGDQVFFWPSDRSDPNKVQHTGLVYKVDSTYVYTIEGNTSGASGVIANGGGVCKKKYKLNYARLAGFGRPDWSMDGGDAESSASADASASDTTASAETEDTSASTSGLGSRMLENGSSGEDVKELQEALNRLSCITTKLTVDGKYGSVTVSAVKTFQKAYAIQVDGKYGSESHKTLTAALVALAAQEETPMDSEQTPTKETTKEETVTIVASAPDRKVNIRVGNGTDYGRITQVADGKTYPWVATAENGWHAIVIGKRVGWVSGKYSWKN